MSVINKILLEQLRQHNSHVRLFQVVNARKELNE